MSLIALAIILGGCFLFFLFLLPRQGESGRARTQTKRKWNE
jgi:hypothetical protein